MHQLRRHEPMRAILSAGFMERRAGGRFYSGLRPANLTTLPHFSVSAAMNLPNSAVVIGIGALPRSESRVLILGSARAALISLLSFSIISIGVFLGAPIPCQPVAS